MQVLWSNVRPLPSRYSTPGMLALRREAIALSAFQDSTISIGNNVYRETTIETGDTEKDNSLNDWSE